MAEILALKLAQQDDKEAQMQELVSSAMALVVAQADCWRAWERLKTAVENYTGEHWTKWKV